MSRKRTFLGRFWRLLFIKLPIAFIVISLLWTLLLKWCPVYVTPLMVKRSIEYRSDKDFKTRKTWVPYEKISPEMARAVIASEDNLFNKHNGFDRVAIKQARMEYETGRRKYLRGASTISQQTAKNVFLFPARSYVRKGFEAYFTVLIEWMWSKERIMEVYLNVIETGKGLYGVEAAAEYHFKTTAARLTREQSCLIAACLPNPVRRNAGKPSSYVKSRAGAISSLESKLLYPDWVYHKKPESKKSENGRRKNEERKKKP